jgi:hypothetical protein
MNIANDNDPPMPSPAWKPEPQTIDLDPSPIPDQRDETGHKVSGKPLATGRSKTSENPTDAAAADNPVHDSQRVPPSAA